MARNFFLSPMSWQFEMIGSSSFTTSSIGTGATFSPPAVMISSVYKRSIILQSMNRKLDCLNSSVAAQ